MCSLVLKIRSFISLGESELCAGDLIPRQRGCADFSESCQSFALFSGAKKIDDEFALSFDLHARESRIIRSIVGAVDSNELLKPDHLVVSHRPSVSTFRALMVSL